MPTSNTLDPRHVAVMVKLHAAGVETYNVHIAYGACRLKDDELPEMKR